MLLPSNIGSNSRGKRQGRRKESRARGPTGAKGHLLPYANKYIPEMVGIRGTFWGISWAMPLTVI